MIEIQLFGWLWITLPSALSVFLLLVALTSVTYLSATLAPVLGASVAALRRARALGVATAAAALGAALLGLRVGAAGSGGELIPTLALGVAAAAACGSTAAFALLGAGTAAARLGAAGAMRRAELAEARAREQRQLEAARDAYLAGDDLRAEVAEAQAALARLAASLDKLSATQVSVEVRLDALDDAASAGELGRELRRTRDEVTNRLDLGRRIHEAAVAAAFRLACSAPVRRLLRRRPRDLTRSIGAGGDDGAVTSALSSAMAEIDGFLGEAVRTRRILASLEARRPGDEDDRDGDAWAQAMRDLGAIEDAYDAIRERLGVVVVRIEARGDMEAVASAAGEVSDKARASGIPASDLKGLVDEVTRAESAILVATPPELDARALSAALVRSAAALGESDGGSSLDELLRALREVA
jgi:hypothetical protein